ncbi:hypothetical protein Pth03_26640 [Planotetraspora thailandica]|uniref:Carbohydrate-binding protein n=1 Tax=Planotetraspora thailandica TaxID=487172 RepID=A0A8J3XVS0_9ACTN|nr:hypothetical protein [Planotetraspora thailandica]GII54275.1 hypothetical protein Pth03_26640 [Planotetraspora thailandica]
MFLKLAVTGLWLRWAAAVAAAAAAAGLWLWWAAPRDDGNDRWKLVAAQSSVTYGQVIATGEHNAWAFGWDILGIGAWLPMADGPHHPTAFHWDGDRWTKSDFPVKRGNVGPVAASAPSNVWALADDEGITSVLRWDGRTWTIVQKLPATAGSLAVTADNDVWVFGDHKAWHYNGATWSEQSVSFHTFRVSARSASDIWALHDDAPWVHHFDGKVWTRVNLTPALPTAPPPSDDSPTDPTGPRLTAITADSSGIWITGEIGASSFLLFQTGSGWRSEDTSAKAGRMIRGLPPVPDGRGGHWFLGSTDINGNDSALAHRDPSGHWTRVPSGGELTSLSAVPGGPLLATGVIDKVSGVFRNLP